jgi:hypothetical protein
LERSTDFVHFVDKSQTRDFVFVGLSPDSFGLGLNSGVAVEDHDSAIENTERSFDLGSEINVARSVDNVDTVILKGGNTGRLMVIPRSRSWTIESVVVLLHQRIRFVNFTGINVRW